MTCRSNFRLHPRAKKIGACRYVTIRATAGLKKNLCATACLLLANAAPDLLLHYLHRLASFGVLFKNFKEVIGHGNDRALLCYEQFELLAQ